MLVSYKHNFIFTKTKKTAGTSIEVYFEKYCLPEKEQVFYKPNEQRDEYISEFGIIGARGVGATPREKEYYNHMSAEKILEKVGHDFFYNAYKFTAIRNPFDKMVSHWWFVLNWDERKKLYKTDFSFIRKEFIRWLTGLEKVPYDGWAYFIRGKMCMDYFIRFEQLESGIRYVCSELNLPFDSSEIPRFKTNTRKNTRRYQEYYDETTRRIIEEKYACELDTFGYSFED